MKIRAILAGLALGIAALTVACAHPAQAKKISHPPTPLCPPDNPTCGLNN